MKLPPFISKILTTIAFAAVIYVNYLANALPINGMTTGALSALYPNLFVPAGITFSIWGLIYLSLFLLTIAIWKSGSPWVEKGWIWWLIGTHILNIGWILAWHYREVGISVVIMMGLLSSLLVLYLKIAHHPLASNNWIYRMALGLYTSWICVALIANMTALLVSQDLQSTMILSEETWTLVMIGVAVLISGSVTYLFGDPFFGAVTAWALFGIFLRNQYSATDSIASINWTSLTGIMIMIIVMLIIFLQKGVFQHYPIRAKAN
jgi:benzodiazapine receptor